MLFLFIFLHTLFSSSIIRQKPRVVLYAAHSLIKHLSPFLRQIDFALDWMHLEAGQALYRYDITPQDQGNRVADKKTGAKFLPYVTTEHNFQIIFPGGGGTPIYWLYGYVPLERVWFSSHLVWYRV